MRWFLVGLAALLLTGCGPSKPKLHLFIWSDFIAKDVIEAFEKENDCTVVLDTFDTNEAMYAKLKTASPGYDLIFPSNYFISLMEHEGLLHKIDPARLKNYSNIDTKILQKLQFTPSDFALPYLITFTGLAWNQDRVNLDQISWTVFGNPKYRGRMTMLNDIREAIGAALITLGYSINTTKQEELDQAIALMVEWKHNLAKFESEQYKIGLATHEYFVAQGFNTDIGQLQQEVPAIQFAIPKEGGVVSFDMVAIPDDVVHLDLAYAFIDHLLNPQVAALNMEQTKGFTPVKGVDQYIDTVYKDNPTIFPAESSLAKCQEIKDLGKDILLYTKAWDQIKMAP